MFLLCTNVTFKGGFWGVLAITKGAIQDPDVPVKLKLNVAQV